jgi:hypothetical protein
MDSMNWQINKDAFNKAKSAIPYLAVVVFSFVWFRSFLSPGSVMIGDFAPLSSYVVQVGQPYTINPVYAGGAFNFNLESYPLYSVINVLTLIAGSEVAYRIFFMSIPTIAGFSFILFLKRSFPNSRFGPLELTLSAIFYAMNPWVITEAVLPGHMNSLYLAYAITPIFFTLLLKYLRNQKTSLAIYCSLTLALIGIIFYYWLFYLFITFFIAVVLFGYFSSRKKGSLSFAKYLLKSMGIYGLAIVISSFWFLPFAVTLFSGSIASSLQSVCAAAGLSVYAVPTNTVRLLGYWWPQFTFSAFQSSSHIFNIFYSIFSFTLAGCAIVVFAFRRSFDWPDKKTYVFALLSVVTLIVLSSGTQLLGSLYVLMVNAVPFMNDPIMFLGFVAFFYALILALAVRFLRSKLQLPNANVQFWQKKGGRAVLSVSLVLLIVGSMISVWPAFTGSFNEAYNPVPQPDAYSRAYKWLSENSDGYRTLWLPSSGVYDEFNWTKQNGAVVGVSNPVAWQTQSPALNVPFGIGTSPSTSLFILQIQDMIYQNKTKNIGEVLSVACTKFVAIRTDQLPSDFSSQLLNGALIQKDLALVWYDGPLYIFENQEPIDYVQTKSSVLVTYGGFNSLLELPSVGFDLSKAATLFPECIDQATLFKLVEDNSTLIYLPSTDMLSLKASLIPRNHWVDLTRFNNGDWQADTTTGVGTLDALYSGFSLASSRNSQLVISVNNSGNTTFLVRYVGDEVYATVDGTNLAPEETGYTIRYGFNWIRYSCFSKDSSILTLNFSSNFHAVNSVIILPSEVYQKTVESIDSILDKVIFSIPSSSLYPTDGSIWQNMYDSNISASQKWAINFPSTGGAAGSPTYLNLKQAKYRLAALGSVVEEGSPTAGSLELYCKENASWSPLTFEVGQQAFLLSTQTFELQKGAFPFQIKGKNMLLTQLIIYPSSVKGPVDTTERTKTLQATNNNPTTHTGTTMGGSAVTLSTSYSYIWKTYIDGVEAKPLLINGFSTGILNSGDKETSYRFYYSIQTYGDIGFIFSVFSIFVSVVYLATKRGQRNA